MSNKHTDKAHVIMSFIKQKFIKHFPLYQENKNRKKVFTQKLHVEESSGQILGN